MSHEVEMEPGVTYHFRVTACNDGGESFPTEVLSAYFAPRAKHTVLVVNGFRRLSSPAVVQNDSSRFRPRVRSRRHLRPDGRVGWSSALLRP